MHKTDISIVCPLYHGQRYISTILEMLNKNLNKLKTERMPREIEVIFVNDNPGEKISLPEDRSADIKLKLLEPGRNQGIHKSRVHGLSHANGNYILFLDQDDVIREDYLVSQLSHIGERDAVLCNGYYQNSRVIYSSRQIQESVAELSEYLKQKNVIISPGQVLLKRESIPEQWKNDCFIQNGSDDVLLWILMLSSQKTFAVNDEKLFWHMESDENTSYQFGKMQQSILELLEWVMQLDCLSFDEKEVFRGATEKRLARYDRYVQLQKGIEMLKKEEYLARLHEYFCGKKVAVYGWGIFGREFWKLGKKAGINICYGIDAGKDTFMEPEIPLYAPEEEFPETDLIVVTPVTGFQEIKKKIQKKSGAQIVLLGTLLEWKEINHGESSSW